VRFEIIDNCPVPAEAAPVVQEARRRSGETLQSAFRGVEARSLLRRLGKRDQATLYYGWLRRLRGFRPAHPPGHSTHECYSDGVWPPGYRSGQRIPPELVGQDWGPNSSRVIAAYRAMGIPAVHPYSSALELQHVGYPKVPKRMPKPLERGQLSPRVIILKRRLAFVRRPDHHTTYWGADRKVFFSKALEDAVKRYQADHHLKADGVVGEHTWAQLDASTRYWKAEQKKAKKAKPTPAKPHPSPKHAAAKLSRGVDVSSNNGDVNWGAVRRAGIDFAFVKVTEGLTYEDPTYTKARVDALRKAGLRFGVYHFARPQPGHAAKDEAARFINRAKSAGWGRRGDLRPVLDIEWCSGLGTAQLQKWIKDFCGEVKRRVGVDPIIYTGLWFWGPRVGNPSGNAWKQYPLWLAAYVKDPTNYTPRAWSAPSIWQYTDKGRVAGVNGSCDISQTHLDLSKLSI
jgi:GH25 family lysozyme M1 (1,4-beta-N-acetylmuramidase)